MTLDAAHLAVLSLLVLVAYGLKGLTGFGPALLFVPVASLLFGQPLAVAVSGALDVTSGAAMTAGDPRIRRGREGLLLGAAMAAGTVVGVVALGHVPRGVAAGVLVAAVLIGLASVVTAHVTGPCERSRGLGPRSAAVSLPAGIVGGLTGINGPLLILYLQHRLTPHDLRTVVTRVLLVSAVVRVLTFLAVQDDRGAATAVTLACLPLQLVGLFAGSRLSRTTSPRTLATVNSVIVAVSVLLAAYNAA